MEHPKCARRRGRRAQRGYVTLVGGTITGSFTLHRGAGKARLNYPHAAGTRPRSAVGTSLSRPGIRWCTQHELRSFRRQQRKVEPLVPVDARRVVAVLVAANPAVRLHCRLSLLPKLLSRRAIA